MESVFEFSWYSLWTLLVLANQLKKLSTCLMTFSDDGIKVSVNDFIIKAAAIALQVSGS